MIHAKIENQEEQELLDNALKESKTKNWYRRLKIIVKSSQGVITRHLSKEYDLGETTIRSYIHKYNQGGLEKLKPGKSTGRPPKIAHWRKEDWEQVFQQTPDQYEKLNTYSRQWTLELMSVYLKEYHNIDVSLSTIHNSLLRTRISIGRSKLHVSSPDPDYQVKRRQVEVLQGLHSRGN